MSKIMTGSLVASLTVLCALGARAYTNTPDESGIVPTRWWDCQGNFSGEHSKGSADSNDYVNKNVQTNWTEFTRGGAGDRKAVVVDAVSVEKEGGYPWFRVGDDIKAGRDWTVSVTARTASHDNSKWTAFFGLGHVNNATNYVLAVTKDSDVKLCLMNGNNAPVELVSTNVPGAFYQFHNYVLAYNYSARTLALYVDGVKAGEYAGLEGHGGNTECNLGRGTSTDSRFAATGTTAGFGSAFSDFRVYGSRLLTDAQIANLAAANPVWPTKSIGCLPATVDQLDGTHTGLYAGTKGNYMNSDTETWCASPMRDAGAFVYAGTSAKYRASWGGNFGTGADKSWTCVFSGVLGAEVEDTVLVGLGHPNNVNCPVVCSDGVGKVKVSLAGQGTAGGGKNAHTNVISGIEVPDAATKFHTYALVNDQSADTLTFYVDGVQKASVEYADACGGNEYVLCHYGSGSDHGGFRAAPGTAIDDFRLYDEALTAEQVAAYAEEFPVADADGILHLSLDDDSVGLTVDSFDRTRSVALFVDIADSVLNAADQTGEYTLIRSSEPIGLALEKFTAYVTNASTAKLSLSEEKTELRLLVMPTAAFHSDFNGTLAFTGNQSGSWDSAASETNFLATADGSAGAVVIAGGCLHVKNMVPVSYYDADVWTVSANVRSIETDNALLFANGFNNNSTVGNWGISSAGKDKLRYSQWDRASSTRDVEVVFDVPDAAVRYHTITLVHKKDSTDSDESLKIYVDGVLAVSGNYYRKRNNAGNDMTLGGHATTGWNGGSGFTRGEGVAFNAFTAYAYALSTAQVRYLADRFPPWPEMVTVGTGTAYDATAAGSNPVLNRMMRLEAGSTVMIGAGATLAFSFDNGYDKDEYLFLPSDGTVTLKVMGLNKDNAADYAAAWELLSGKVFSASDLERFVATSNAPDRYRVKLSVADGKLMGRVIVSGLSIVIR